MSYIYFTEQEKATANDADIAAYLLSRGEAVKRVGREKVWESPSGKVSINGSLWYSQYEQTGGGAINFVRKYFGKTFPEAIRDLLGQSVGNETQPVTYERKAEERLPFEVPPKHTDMRRVYGYLLNERCLDRDVIHAFAHAGLLYEESEHHNAVFLGLDENGTSRHAQKRSTSPVSDFKNNVAGSNADYSFHWNGTSDKLYIFEAPIDMLAYISLHKDQWERHSYVALCSTADRSAIQMLKDRPNLKKVYICLDNDSAGIEGAYRIAESIRAVGEYELWRSMSKNKDWDEDLKELHGKAVIPAGRHKKMDVFFDLCTQAQDELQDRLPTLCKGEQAKRYRLDKLFDTIRPMLIDAERCETPEQRICIYKDIGKAIILGCTSKQTPSEIDGCISTIRSLYKPHRDYDSSMCLAHSISSDLAGIEAHINHKGALTRQETEDVHASLLRIAGNCFRQCGTIMRESHEAEMHGLTISQ